MTSLQRQKKKCAQDLAGGVRRTDVHAFFRNWNFPIFLQAFAATTAIPQFQKSV